MARPKKSDQIAEKKKTEFISPEQQEANADERRSRLKTLIILGKERGYLTYAEINDHLPDDVQNSEQIDGIIGMINDMGIQVYEEAPDAEVLLMSDAPPAVTDEDAVEEAEQALATVDSDFGRTTDPVRMYMREMGTVDLLTRGGGGAAARAGRNCGAEFRRSQGFYGLRTAAAGFRRRQGGQE